MRLQHIVVAMVLLSTSALAEELKPFQKEAKIAFEKSIASALNDANTACGTRLKVKTNFDWYTKDWDGVGYEDACKEVFRVIAATCERPEHKKILAKKVTGVACQFTRNILSEIAQSGGMVGFAASESPNNETQPRNVSMWKGLVLYQMHKGDKTIADDTRAVLQDVLKAGSR
ncbi:hypothetical protein [Corallococcus sicarius]|uniref:Uncharacterized protein n=1 Tax=Corallococcus sicarius TaxID=2316726 RepID=A0A3A8NHH6_9BACT|nr:hypothetical protein [Corallococcus sicarius]RKH38874.1 hypothetical protein D7X12_25100 [Corallococcus sicarius]